jgi:hypothetical protein
MTAVDDMDLAQIVGELHDQGSGEPLRRIQALPALALTQQRLFHARHQRRQVRLMIGRIAEDTDVNADGRDGGQALPPYIADHGAHPERGLLHHVEIAADQRHVLGRHIAGGDPQIPQPAGRTGQHGPLSHLRRVPRPAGTRMLQTQRTVQTDRQRGNGRQRDLHGDVALPVVRTVQESQTRLHHHRRESDTDHPRRPEQRNRRHRRHGQQWSGRHRGRRQQIHQRRKSDHQGRNPTAHP